MTCLDTNSNTVQDSMTINFTQYHPVDIYTTYQVNGASQLGPTNVNYTITGPNGINLTGTQTGASTGYFHWLPAGIYTLIYQSGGLAGTTFSGLQAFGFGVSNVATGANSITFTISDFNPSTGKYNRNNASVIMNFVTTSNLPAAQCSDGIDNDNDGKIDYPVDLGCSSASDNDENSRPTITLLGNATATTTEGDVYTDAGATAFDEEDGNITANIVVSGNTIATTTPAGTYAILFNVADSKGVLASTTRTVIVNPKANGGGGNNNGGGNTGNGENNNGGGNSGNGNTGGNTGGNNSGGGGAVNLASANGPVGFSGLPMSFKSAVNTGTSGNAGSGTVLGAKTEKQQGISSDNCNYLLDYLKFGQKNNPFEVKKLQYFLRNFEGFKTVASTGVFDLKTLSAVHDFQARYNDDVLRPWALPYSTGYVYITTKKKVNEIYCEREFLLTTEQKREIAEFNALMQRLKAGQSVSGGIVKKEIKGAVANIDKTEKESSDVFALKNKESENNSETVLESATSSLAALLSDILPRELYVENSGKVSGERAFQDMLFYFFRYKLFIVSIFLFGVLVLLVYRILKDTHKNKI